MNDIGLIKYGLIYVLFLIFICYIIIKFLSWANTK